MDFNKIQIKKFDGKDFVLWKNKVICALDAADCSEAIETEFNVPDDDGPLKVEAIAKNKKAKYILMNSIEDSILRRLDMNSAKDMWITLMNKYQDSNVQNIIFLRKQFLNLKQNNNETLDEFIDRIRTSRQHLESCGHAVSDQDTALTILQGLHPAYENFVQCLTVNKDLTDDLDLEDIIQTLMIEEKRRKSKKEEKQVENEHVFHSKYKNDMKKNKFFKNVKCFNCNKMGHYARDCKAPNKGKQTKRKENTNINVEIKDSKEIAFNTQESKNNNKRTWLLDSGATSHMCCEKSLFKELKPYQSSIKVGDGRTVKVNGKGTIKCKAKINNKETHNLTINDVLYVPDLSLNLISIGKLAEKGHEIRFANDKCEIKLANDIIIEGTRNKENKTLYELNMLNEDEQALTVQKVLSIQKPDDMILWHYRLGHLSYENMRKLKSEDVIFNNKATEKDFCKSCALGKSTKLPHRPIEKKNNNHITIHSDLVGPMQTKSIGSKEYILTYLCSQTEYSFVYFLKFKSEQFEKFKEFKAHYENLTNTKIKELRTDNGKEYMSNAFKQYLKDNGIKHNTSVEYCPQSNGKAERLNRTLIEKARCMLIAGKVNLNLWSTAIDTANYLRNRSPSIVLNNKTPYEALFKHAPSVMHLKVFGCEAYPLEINKKR